ncbi:ModD protein [Methyloraptor flagellatus]|uniref:Putative pyrophosphorylase ModD n=1 Tax=Methyloraptor flagellatus TaxID=3162530 RepID=A0AAU7XG41_9HYPH
MISASDIERLIAEDVPSGDLTTEALGIARCPARMIFMARRTMVAAGIDVAVRILNAAGGEANAIVVDGFRATPGTPLLDAQGSAGALHRSWKVAQTLIEIASGIATATGEVLDAARAAYPAARVACTRKTMPGARLLSQLAVRAGGGILHRHGLSETILVFAEHRAFLPDLTLAEIATRLRIEQPEKTLAIEVGDVTEAIAAAEAGFDTIQLEKFTPGEVETVATAFATAGLTATIAAAGGISPENAGSYVRAGAKLLVTSWPYTARPRDVAVTLGPR